MAAMRGGLFERSEAYTNRKQAAAQGKMTGSCVYFTTLSHVSNVQAFLTIKYSEIARRNGTWPTSDCTPQDTCLINGRDDLDASSHNCNPRCLGLLNRENAATVRAVGTHEPVF